MIKKRTSSTLLFLPAIVVVLVFVVVLLVFSGARGVFQRTDLTQAASCPADIASVTSFGGYTFSKQCLNINGQIYGTDSRYTFFRLDPAMQGGTYIQTPNAEIKDNPNLSWSVTLNQPGTLFIATRHVLQSSAASWITSQYTRQTDDNQSNVNQYLLRKNEQGLIGLYDIYKRQVSAGTYQMGPAADVPGNAYSMYLVIFVPSGSSTATPTPTVNPTQTTNPTLPPVSGDLPCGRFPNASAGCMPVSYQSWFDNVPASAQTMNVNYTPRLLHQHYECNVPAVRANGQFLKEAMKISCTFVRYNSIIPFSSKNSAWYRSQNQGSTYEQFTMNMAPCQSTKYEGKECKTENIHTVRAGDFSKATEMRYTPNADFDGLDGQRHFLSSNWQTGIGYRSSSELTSRYWIGTCGTYQRLILKNADKYMKGSEPIPTVKGTITIPFESNGGCGDQFKTFVFLDPSQHVRVEGTQTGTTLMETNAHFNGNLTWDTTKTTNGVHSLLFINMEGTSKYVSASGVAVKYNVQN